MMGVFYLKFTNFMEVNSMFGTEVPIAQVIYPITESPLAGSLKTLDVLHALSVPLLEGPRWNSPKALVISRSVNASKIIPQAGPSRDRTHTINFIYPVIFFYTPTTLGELKRKSTVSTQSFRGHEHTEYTQTLQSYGIYPHGGLLSLLVKVSLLRG